MQQSSVGGAGRTARLLQLVGVSLVLAAVVLAGLGWLVRRQSIAAAERDTKTFTAPRELMISGDLAERGLWVEQPGTTSQFVVTVEDEAGTVEYRRYGLIGSSSTLEIDGTTYRLDGEFAPQRNTYTVDVAARDDVGKVRPLKMAIGPPDGYELPTLTVLAAGGAVLAFLLGAVLATAGLALRIVALRRIEPPATAPAG